MRFPFYAIFFLLALLTPTYSNAQWDAYAGVPNYGAPALVVNATSSTSGTTANKAVDGDLNTQWISGKPLPLNYVNRSDLNIIYQLPDSLITSTGGTIFSRLTDGNLSQLTFVNAVGGKARLDLSFENAQPVLLFHLKSATTANIDIYAHTSSQDSTLVGTYATTNAYSWKKFTVDMDTVEKISLQANGAFYPFEMSALGDFPKEYLVVDLVDTVEVGYLKTRHWAGTGVATGTNAYLSMDGQQWSHVAALDPNALQEVITPIDNPQLARYVKIEHTLTSNDNVSVYCWEVDAISVDGPFGGLPVAQQSTVTVNDLLGINTIWGWGHDEYTDMLDSDEGPHLFDDYATHARYYHNMSWDVTDPDSTVDYHNMALGNGTQSTWWLNWDREYIPVDTSDLDVMVTVKIGNFAASAWDTPYQSAYDYGYNFADHFGALNGNGSVKMVEVGNEPWSYSSLDYQTILNGFIDGVKDADSTMLVFPCALQASNPDTENSSLNHFIGTKVTQTEGDKLDGLNIHAYSWMRNNAGARIATYPENKLSTFHEVLSMIRFRDQNMPQKPIYLTEWGWDMAGGGESCTHSECVTEDAGSAYTIRGALMALRLGIERATWYFYANYGTSELFSRSGLTASDTTNFTKKKAFTALEALVHQVGATYFLRTIQEDDNAWVFEMGDSSGQATHLIGWRPIDGDSTSILSNPITYNVAPDTAFLLDGNNPLGTPTSTPAYANGTMNLELNAQPTVIVLQQSSSRQQSNFLEIKPDAAKQEFAISRNGKMPDWDFTLSPNPSFTETQIQLLGNNIIPTNFKLEVFDGLGRLLWNEHLNQQQTALNWKQKSLVPGYYWVRITDTTGYGKTQKMLLMN